jgi:branched-chain amino acid transport system substrate-binding protein
MLKARGSTQLVAVGLALALAAAACANKQDTAGSPAGAPDTTGPAGATFTMSTDKCDNPGDATKVLSGNEIKLGSSFPVSGVYAAYGNISKGWEALFKAQNANGGVNGKQITYVTKDDGYMPEQTKVNAQEFIDQDNAFALFNVVGTPNNLAIRGQLNQDCVPDLFAATGSQLMGNPAKYPWLIGSLPTYATEGAVFASYLKQNKPQAKVGIVRQNDEVGDGYEDAFRKGIEGSGVTITDVESFDPSNPDTSSQVTKINGSGADTILVGGAAVACPNTIKAAAAISGWNPLIYVSGTCSVKVLMSLAGPAANGVMSTYYLKQPLDPQWANDPAMKKYKETLQSQGMSQEDIDDAIVAYGWTIGDLMVQTLQKSPQLSRQSVMQTAYSLKGITPGLVLPGITANTNGAMDPYPIEQLQIGVWNGQFLDPKGGLIDYEGKTSTAVDQTKNQ